MDKAPCCCSGVIPFNSARSFSKPAELLSRESVKKIIASEINAKVIELGAGCLRNALALQRIGCRVTVLEVKGIEKRFASHYQRFRELGGKVVEKFPKSGSYDLALATFVIETICDPKIRERLLQETSSRLKPNSAFAISVRGAKDLVTAHYAGRRCSDGFITPLKTFARSYSKRQLSILLFKTGFSKIKFLHRPSTQAPELLHAIAWTPS